MRPFIDDNTRKVLMTVIPLQVRQDGAAVLCSAARQQQCRTCEQSCPTMLTISHPAVALPVVRDIVSTQLCILQFPVYFSACEQCYKCTFGDHHAAGNHHYVFLSLAC